MMIDWFLVGVTILFDSDGDGIADDTDPDDDNDGIADAVDFLTGNSSFINTNTFPRFGMTVENKSNVSK